MTFSGSLGLKLSYRHLILSTNGTPRKLGFYQSTEQLDALRVYFP